MHALAGAALMFEIARRCAENKIVDCECSFETAWNAPPPQGQNVEGESSPPTTGQQQPINTVPAQYHWGGCSDNIQSARLYVQAFLNFPEERPRAIGYRSYRSYRQVNGGLGAEKPVPRKKTQRLVNRHNYKAGIKV